MYEDDGSKKQEKLNYNEDGDDEQESERNHVNSESQRLWGENIFSKVSPVVNYSNVQCPQ